MLDPFVRKLKGLIDLTPADERAVRALPVERVQTAHHRDVLPSMRAPDYLYIVISGWAARYGLRADGSRRITGFLIPGDFCGIHAVAGAVMDHSIVAITDVELAKIPIAEVEELVSKSPLIGKALWRAKLVDEAILRQWLLSSADSLQAIARMLCELHARADAAGLCHDGYCEVPITQEQLGDAVGITSVHTNRTLGRLRTDGFAELKNGRLVIADHPRLASVAQWNPRYLSAWVSPN